MSKKYLNEVRRFMKLANLNENVTSNFVGNIDEEEMYQRDEEEIDVEAGVEEEIPGMGPDEEEVELDMDAELDIEDPMDPGGEEDAESLVLRIASDLEALAAMAGVNVQVSDQGADEIEMGDEIDMEDPVDMGPEEGGEEEVEFSAEEEETLDEILNSVLSEEGDDDKKDDDKKDDDDDDDSSLGSKARARSRGRERAIPRLRQEADDTATSRDEVVQEITRRVKRRLAKMASKSRK